MNFEEILKDKLKGNIGNLNNVDIDTLFNQRINCGGYALKVDACIFSKNGSFEKELRENFTVGGYIFFLNCEQARKVRILMYSSIPAETVAPMGIKAYDDLDRLLSDADLEGKSIYIIPTGSTVLPVVTESNC